MPRNVLYSNTLLQLLVHFQLLATIVNGIFVLYKEPKIPLRLGTPRHINGNNLLRIRHV